MKRRISKILSLLIAVFLVLEQAEGTASGSPESCQKLASCAWKKCVHQKRKVVVDNASALLPSLLSHTDFSCIFGPSCYEKCSECGPCAYVQRQIHNIVMRTQTDGSCGQFESCAKQCIEKDIRNSYNCIFHERCLSFCLDDGQCESCQDVIKRVFTVFCYKNGLREQIGIPCRRLFSHLLEMSQNHNENEIQR